MNKVLRFFSELRHLLQVSNTMRICKVTFDGALVLSQLIINTSKGSNRVRLKHKLHALVATTSFKALAINSSVRSREDQQLWWSQTPLIHSIRSPLWFLSVTAYRHKTLLHNIKSVLDVSNFK